MTCALTPDRPLGFAGIALLTALAMALAEKTHMLCALICLHGHGALSQICGG